MLSRFPSLPLTLFNIKIFFFLSVFTPKKKMNYRNETEFINKVFDEELREMAK